MGYSQGAWAGVAVQRDIELNGLGSYNLVASSFGAGPYNIETTAASLISQENLVQPYFFPYIINSYIEYEQFSDDIKLNSIFKTPYDTIIPKVYNGEYSSSEINGVLSNLRSDLIQSSYLSNYPNAPYNSVQSAYQNNSIVAWETEVPTRLFHSEDDEIVPVSVSLRFALEMSNAGTVFEKPLIPFSGLSHLEATVPFGIATIQFFLPIKFARSLQN
jgi:pimeloyl-ACP methyl ester carboxylesterase